MSHRPIAQEKPNYLCFCQTFTQRISNCNSDFDGKIILNSMIVWTAPEYVLFYILGMVRS